MDFLSLILLIVLLPVVVLLLLVFGWLALFFLRHFSLWLEAKASGIEVSWSRLVLISWRGLSPATIVSSLKVMRKAGLQVSSADLESHQLAGGNLERLQDATVAAHKAGLQLAFPVMAAIDLAGRDIREAVISHVNPQVLICPAQNGAHQREPTMIYAISQDGIRLAILAKVTVRTKIERLVGTAGAETVIARVGEGIVAAIGKAKSHREILERPEIISQAILSRGLDSSTCFEILSVDIADIDVLDNVSARLRTAQAEADKRIARAQAEERRAKAVATHQEMQSKTVGMEVKVVSARSELPQAVAGACRGLNFGQRQPWPALVPANMRWQQTI